MSISSRIHDTIENWQAEWKDRLKGWMASWVEIGAEKLFDAFEPGLRDEIKPQLDQLKAIPNLPPEWQNILDKATAASSFIQIAALAPYLIGALFGLAMGAVAPIARFGSYPIDKVIHSARFDPLSAITAWRRDKVTYEKLFDDLRDQGWSDDRIETLKFVTLFYPAPADLVRWQAREVFEPAMVTKYGLDSEFGEIVKEPFYKAGMTDEQILNYWRAHWEHASWMQVVEMLHRKLLTEEDVYDWFRLVEIPPFWRDLLIQTAYTWPTRVDVRRWWDMRTIDETRLRELYEGMGYRGKNLEDYIKWTKVYTDFPMMMTRFRNGWITEEDIRTWLRGLEIPAERIDQFIEEKTKPEQAARVAEGRELTKTDIYKGIKQERITRDDGVELLMDLGFDEDEATFLVDTNIPVDEEVTVVNQRELTKADILKGMKTEVLTETEAQEKLVALRYTSDDAWFLIKIYLATITPPTEPRDREASKADILLAVKKGLITPEDGYLMLLDIGFTPDASAFILEVRAEVSPFSPINFTEFKDRTHKYRVAAGLEAKPMPEELKKAADEVLRLTGDIKSLEQSITEEKRGLVDEEILPAETTKRLKSLQVKLHRAEAKLALAKSEYDRLVAEWRHGITE